MKLRDGAHLSYCTNIHPGESWEEVDRNLRRYLPAVKQRISPNAAFGVGLRLSAPAAAQLLTAEHLQQFQAWLMAENLYVFSINGFPYDKFHGQSVKDAVYRPNWLHPARAAYTRNLANILARLLPEGVTGSISTVPGAYKKHLTDASAASRIAENLVEFAVYLHHLQALTGRNITLALEPEPDCMLETVIETVAFFSTQVFGFDTVRRAMRLSGLGWADSEALLRRHLGVCLDTCHAAIGFEEPAAVLSSLRAAGVAVHKLQLSAGLKVLSPGMAERLALKPFAEDIYLHQTKALQHGCLRHYADLDDALADSADAEEWRIHYHVPLWAERLAIFASTADWLEELLDLHRQQPVSSNLEVETYTWSVLPEQYRKMPVEETISNELAWVLVRLA